MDKSEICRAPPKSVILHSNFFDMQLSEQEQVRREKLTKLRDMGIDPYPAALYPVNALAADIKAGYEEGKKVVISGRLMSRRIQGKASFAELQDS